MRLVVCVLLSCLSIAGCNWLGVSGTPGEDRPVQVKPGEPFWLDIGETAHGPEGLTLTFIDLVGESRCPADVTCVWGGQGLVFAGWSAPNVRTRPDTFAVGQLREGDQDQIGPFRLLDLRPYPRSDQPQPPKDTYRAQFVLE